MPADTTCTDGANCVSALIALQSVRSQTKSQASSGFALKNSWRECLKKSSQIISLNPPHLINNSQTNDSQREFPDCSSIFIERQQSNLWWCMLSHAHRINLKQYICLHFSCSIRKQLPLTKICLYRIFLSNEMTKGFTENLNHSSVLLHSLK